MQHALIILLFILTLASSPALHAREWKFTGIAAAYEADFVGMQNGWVVLREANGNSAEFPFSRFAPADQQYLKALAAGERVPAVAEPGKPITSSKGYNIRTVETLTDEVVTLSGNTVIHVTGEGDPIRGSTFIFTSPDAFLFLDRVRPSLVIEKFLSRIRVDRVKARADGNVRVVQYGSGAVVIPHKPDFVAMTIYDGKALTGASVPLQCFVEYAAAKLRKLKRPASSFVLKRGYMATLAEKENGTGISHNYVAQDHDLVVENLPAGFENGIGFVRIFPWSWTHKKGVAGGIWQDLNVGWFYDWNIGANWTKDPDPTTAQQKDAIREMIKMLDNTPFVERYAIYNWVEEVRHIKNQDNSLTPAGEVYRDKVSPLAYIQADPGR